MRSAAGLVDLFIDFRDLIDPDLALAVLHVEAIIDAPMEVVGDVRYLLVDALQGVAYDSPRSPPRSTSCFALHSGHWTLILDVPSSLIRR